jgi:hypothetical protein
MRILLTCCLTQYPDTPFVLPMSPPLVILPITVLDEVRNLPEDKVSFTKEVQRLFLARHTGIGDSRPEVLQAVKVDLTRHIASTLDGLQDEIRYSFEKELGDCKEWTSVYLYSKMLRIVALLSGRVFVGRPLSRDEEWIKSTINYTVDCVAAGKAARKYPSWMRGLVAGYLPEIKRVHQHKIRGGQLLEPILKAQLSKLDNEKIQNEESGDEQGTFISWILKHTPENERRNPVALANNQMVCKFSHTFRHLPYSLRPVSFAAIHTTTMATCQAIYDLVARREYIQPLRDEIEQVIAEDGHDIDGDGFLKLKKQSITKLRKLDSFLKETQRLSPPGFGMLPSPQITAFNLLILSVSNSRITTAPLTLSTGHTIPKGTRIAIPAYAVQTSPSTTTYSPSYNPTTTKPPTEFDGFRYYNLRNMEGKENKHQFVTTSPDSLNFGHGNHACPGRFFASNEIKVVLIELLRSWDFRLKGDVDMVGGEEKRPESYELDLGVTPNVTAEIEFRRREE